MKFYYSDAFAPISSWLGESFYNEHTGEAVIDMNGVYYVYEDVDESTWKNFRHAQSPGRFVISGSFGYGYRDEDLEPEPIEQPAPPTEPEPRGLYARTVTNTIVVLADSPEQAAELIEDGKESFVVSTYTSDVSVVEFPDRIN